jgi:pyruvate/2-oxoglutarate dehydrogenase complex dihydrolipoamide acyltransferase (E2) component
MALEFKLPDIGEGVAEGEIVKWLVDVGATVKEHQAVVEVMTDKATVEIPAPAAGKITAIRAKAGDVVPVGSVIFVLETAAGSPAPRQSHGALPSPRRPSQARRGARGPGPAALRLTVPRRPAPADCSSSSSPTSAKAWPRARSSSGSWRPAPRSRSTSRWSR